ncbi:DUF1797 family protein [Granulicatella sp. zg-ZJ]|uniref:YkuJ family protein n=1 Tax=unclassified Granulicatella TaxID=2630493 RepID=UPI0013BF8DBE|nr:MULTISPECIES: YkuJ family protein [unclassified Granulicatella]MBS4749492.1 YkuJ family protein [Carnobacteriaceae bacterium zg-ZUI78]NEW62214.1 DUF1797 family protein [Granulicatella sp. zg-ZJ]NEW66678.1 DUF1797 family protein [Granulicatella sp. zg-84]QMI85017.1 YkuJ family protein [Carnobacteriaceae bacterium zg-84]
MKSSQLAAIIRRLEAMVEDTSDVETRRFEKDGVEKCVVRYNHETESFELEETGTNQPYQFDELDLVAIEIFELLQDA